MTTMARPGSARAGAEQERAAQQGWPGPGTDDRPRKISSRTADGTPALLGSIAGSFGLVWILYDRLLKLSGMPGHILSWFVVFLLLYWAVSAISHPRPIVTDRLVTAGIYGGAFIVVFAVLSTAWTTFSNGYHAALHINFYLHDMNGVEPTAPLNQGGISHAIAGTLVEIGIAIAVSLPLGIGTAVFMTEVGGRLSRVVRTVVEAMTALPDILAGLFIYTTLIVALGLPRSGLAAATALSVMMLPIIARSSEVVLRVVPGGLREASLALGASRWSTVWQVVLPTARPGLATALILGVARGIGETAPVMLTSGASTFFTANPLQLMNSLPLFILSFFEQGQSYYPRMWGAASVLLTLVLVLFVAARMLARTRNGRS